MAYLDMTWHPWYDTYSTQHNVTTMAKTLSFTPITQLDADAYTEYVYVNDTELVGEITLQNERYELRSVTITVNEEDQRNVAVKSLGDYATLEDAHAAAEEELL